MLTATAMYGETKPLVCSSTALRVLATRRLLSEVSASSISRTSSLIVSPRYGAKISEENSRVYVTNHPVSVILQKELATYVNAISDGIGCG